MKIFIFHLPNSQKIFLYTFKVIFYNVYINFGYNWFWMHHLDANWTAGEEARRQLHKNVASNIEQDLVEHPTRHQLYGHLAPITKTIQVRRARHAGHCWRSRDELISDVLLWTPTYGRAKSGRPARTYIQQLWEDTGSSPKDLPEAMNDREKWQERVSDICASGTTWWWWRLILLKLMPFIYFHE